MKFKKSNKPSKFKFGVYNIDKDYLRHLKSCDNKVIDPDITDRYVGPVYDAVDSKGSFSFFVPVDPGWHAADFYLAAFYDGIYAEYFDMTKMIPCTNASLLTVNNDDPALLKFCIGSKEDFENCAEYIINLQTKTSNRKERSSIML